jgi:hypothetical protein
VLGADLEQNLVLGYDRDRWLRLVRDHPVMPCTKIPTAILSRPGTERGR